VAKQHKVAIQTVGNQPEVSTDPVCPSVVGKDEVEWSTNDDLEFQIIFPDDTPFEDCVFHGNKNSPAQSGPPLPGTAGRRYRYIVAVTRWSAVRASNPTEAAVRALDPTVRPTP
jgi:hypothetical protein